MEPTAGCRKLYFPSRHPSYTSGMKGNQQKSYADPATLEKTDNLVRQQWLMLRQVETEYKNAQKAAHAARITAEWANRDAISLQNRADSFARQFEHLQAAVEETKILFTDSTRVLALEVVGMILVACHELWLKPGLDSNSLKLHQSPQFIASSVSRRWRDAAIATPSLWAVLCIPASAGELKYRDGLRLWLARSKACPLRISIALNTAVSWSGPGSTSSIIQVMGVIAPSISRWKDVVISMDSPTEYAIACCYYQADMPLLTTITATAKLPGHCPPNFLRSAPQLTKATFHNFPTWRDKPPPFPRLTDLTFHYTGTKSFTMTALFSLLESCPALVRLLATIQPTDVNDPFNLPITASARLTMPFLRNLGVDKVTYRLLCSDVHLPSLQSLHLFSITTFDQIRNHPAAIASLSFRKCTISTQALLPVLRSKPLLSSLAIIDSKGDANFCNAFIDPSPEGTFLSPALQSIQLINFQNVSCDDLIRLLRARLPTNGLDVPKPWHTFVVKVAQLKPWHRIELDRIGEEWSSNWEGE